MAPIRPWHELRNPEQDARFRLESDEQPFCLAVLQALERKTGWEPFVEPKRQPGESLQAARLRLSSEARLMTQAWLDETNPVYESEVARWLKYLRGETKDQPKGGYVQ